MTAPAVLCFSPQRWDLSFHRAAPVMTRCARNHKVFFVEAPVLDADYTEVLRVSPNLWRVIPHLAALESEQELARCLRAQLGLLAAEHRIDRPILWYYTPTPLPATRTLPRCLTVYDCMRDLSTLAGAPPQVEAWERELIAQADVMFTAGSALFEAKRSSHANLHAIPSSVDVTFFAQARTPGTIPPDQAGIRGPRIGYYGIIDERIDMELLAELADRRPDWHFILIGPLSGITADALPQRQNIHYLGSKRHIQLPAYVADWDAAIVPFALSTATRALCSNKTAEYLAAGKPVVSTAVLDVIEPYQRLGFVRVAEDVPAFVAALEEALRGEEIGSAAQRDAFLAHMSWDATFQRMYDVVLEALAGAARQDVQPAEH